jgi:hypothetical protein
MIKKITIPLIAFFLVFSPLMQLKAQDFYGYDVGVDLGTNSTNVTAGNTSVSIDETGVNVNAGGTVISVKNQNSKMHLNLKGKIVLKVEDSGKAYYVHPKESRIHYLGRPDDAFKVMREQGVGITNKDLEKIEIGLLGVYGLDTDGDGLSDLLEDAIGTDKTKPDTDGDGFTDKEELEKNYNPRGAGSLKFDSIFTEGQKGRIFIQTERNGEAWYISPANKKRYFLGRPADAFSIMRALGLGITNNDFNNI